MSTRLAIQVNQNRQLQFSDVLEGVIDLGRRDSNEWGMPLFTPQQMDWAPGTAPAGLQGKRWRLILAEPESVEVMRHAILVPLAGGKVRLHNGGRVPLFLSQRAPVPPREAVELPLPIEFRLGTITEIRVAEGLHASLQSVLSTGTAKRDSIHPPQQLSAPPSLPVDQARASEWLPTLLEVLQAAATTNEFFPRAARALVEILGLETGQVLLFDGDDWERRACYPPPGPGGVERTPSTRVIQQVREGKTCWGPPESGSTDSGSIMNLSAVVAVPIFDSRRKVVGALYGDRHGQGALEVVLRGKSAERLVEVLAHGVSLGLTRQEQEEAALSQRVLEQFFPPQLAARLVEEGVPRPTETEVTILFADIRRFSRLSENLPASTTIEVCRSVLGSLSECIEQTEGVLVDFIGDGMMAMWGVPDEQPDHAVRACAAALEMFRRLRDLNLLWKEKIGSAVWDKVFEGEIRLGVGINTGMAQVGNVGTDKRVKYGAVGHVVNLASRVEGVTKVMRCPTLLTQATRAALEKQLGNRLSKTFPLRRLGWVRVVNIEEVIELHELNIGNQPDWDTWRNEYEGALTEFEKKDPDNLNFARAARTLGNHRLRNPDDGPSLVLLSRAVQGMLHGKAEGHPVLILGSK
jgi:adenylate cyclase